MKNVIIIYRFLPQYRIEFYNGLRIALQREGVQLHLVYGKSTNQDALKNDEVDIPWAQHITNQSFKLGNTEFLWQPALSYIKGKNLVIVEGANKLLLNYLLMLIRRFSNFKLGVWGHGRNLQIDEKSFRNNFKNIFLKQCDCYFAYTEGVKNYLIKQRFPKKNIVVVQNAIATNKLIEHYKNIPELEVETLRNELGINSCNVGIYCSGMYAEKRIDFLLEICNSVKDAIPDFQMIFIGSGIDAPKVKGASEICDWIHYVGPKFGFDRAIYFKLASIQLMPGLVGLGVLDSFVMQTPLVTTNFPYHSPEIEYLENDINGIMTENSFEDYSNGIIESLKTKKHEKLISGCNEAGKKYTMEQMVENFKNGIVRQLN